MSDDPEFYVIRLPQPNAITTPDGETITDPERIAEIVAVDQAEGILAVAAKGHDCWEHVEHSVFRSARGGLQDAYHCGICGDLIQVG